jgi:SHS2 domain-containing protein
MTTSAPKPFEEVEHIADAALQVYGRDWSELLVNAAHGMFSLMAEWEDSASSTPTEVSLQAVDEETLLIDWLSELLYLHEMDGVVYNDIGILEASPTSLEAVIRGTDRWTPKTAIKAATFNDLSIERTAQGYTVTVVFDT